MRAEFESTTLHCYLFAGTLLALLFLIDEHRDEQALNFTHLRTAIGLALTWGLLLPLVMAAVALCKDGEEKS